MGSVRSVVVVELLPLGQLFLEGHVVVCRNSAETGKLPFGRYRSLESDGLQGAGRIGNALFLRSVAVATPLVQNVMERSWAQYPGPAENHKGALVLKRVGVNKHSRTGASSTS